MENKEKMYHIGLTKEDLKGAKYAILPGDPGRVSKIAANLTNSYLITTNREYTSYLGEIANEKVLVISTGMGGPSTAICVEELALLGITHLIRVGTCGGMQLEVEAGDIVIASSAIRQEGTSKEYLPIEFPAVADFDLTLALKEAVMELNYPYHIGVVQCKDSFYGQHSPALMPVNYELINKWNAWLKLGCLASEMESAALFTVAAYLRVKVGSVFLVIANQEREKAGLDNPVVHDTDSAIKTAVDAIKLMIAEK